MSQEELDDATRRLYLARAELMAQWAARGAVIARKFNYDGLSGIDAVHRFLIDKYHWLPAQVRALSIDEIDLLLAGVSLPAPPKTQPAAGSASGPTKRRGRLTLRK